jgi:hypothetical protein
MVDNINEKEEVTKPSKPLKSKGNYANSIKNFKGIKSPGRPKGSKNKISGSLQMDLKHTYDRLGGLEGMVKWAKRSEENKTRFYGWCIQLLPKEINLNQTVTHDLGKLSDEELQAIINGQAIDI